MSHTGPAARRFYCAFHRWATSRARIESSCGFKRESGLLKPVCYSSKQPTRYYSAGALGHRPINNGNGQKENETLEVLAKWREAAVETPQDRHLGSVAAGEHVIRGREESIITIELGITQSQLDQLYQSYGKDLEGIRSAFDARIEVAGSLDRSPIRSILISGSMEGAAQLTKLIEQNTREPEESNEKSESANFTPKLAMKAFRLRLDVPDTELHGQVSHVFRSDPELLNNSTHGCEVAFERNEWTFTGPDTSIDKAAAETQRIVDQYCSAKGIPIRWSTQWGVLHADGKWQCYGDQQKALFSNESEKLVEETRSMLRRMTHPAVVVTVFGDLEHHGERFPAGVTVSSFTSVTLNPVPFVSFNLKADSRTWKIMRRSGTFRVHVFEDSATAAAVVHQFTQPHENLAKPFEDILGADSVTLTNPKGPPELLHPSLLYILSGKLVLDRCTIVGDHVIVVGSVIEVNVRDPAFVESKTSLAYGDRSYRSLGPAVVSQAPGPSPLASSAGARIPGSSRSFSTTATRHDAFRFDASRPPTNATKDGSGRDLTSLVTDPALLGSTVKEFLGYPPGKHFHPHRSMSDPLTWQKAANHASTLLERKERAGTLTWNEARDLRRTRDENASRLARLLARRSAQDLHMMLDGGFLDFRLSPWLEQTVEKGLVLVLAEFERLRKAHAMDRIAQDIFERERTKLENEYNDLMEVSNRLKAAVEDEQDDANDMWGNDVDEWRPDGGYNRR